MRASVLHGLVFAAVTAGCQSRPLDHGGQGTLNGDAAVESGGAGETDGGTDRGRRSPLGQACGSSEDCSSGFCVDGVCCNSACGGACKSCNGAGTVGICVSVTAGGAPRTAGGCLTQSPSTCGPDGTCDGTGGCRLWPVFTVCMPTHCDGNALVEGKVCDGRGTCRAGATAICAPYRCDPVTATCSNGCTTDAECPGSYCALSGRCYVVGGPDCQSNDECASGFCRQGICCNSACDGACQACNLQEREGSCSPVPGCPGADGGTD
jgi:hypothetical protein